MHTSQAGRGGIAPYHHGDLREELLRVCRNQLRTGGLDAISLRKAAQEIGVSHAAPSRHFTSKHALLTAIAAQGFAEAADELASACRKDADDLDAMCRRYIAFGQQEPELYALMAQPKLVDFSDPEIPHQIGDRPPSCRQDRCGSNRCVTPGRRLGGHSTPINRTSSQPRAWL